MTTTSRNLADLAKLRKSAGHPYEPGLAVGYRCRADFAVAVERAVAAAVEQLSPFGILNGAVSAGS
jgi:hypothetical protein